MATYTVTLPPGVVSVRDKIYTGSNTAAVWSPKNPSLNGGWADGDELVVYCNLNLNPPGVNPPPPASEYVGLCAGACNSTNTARVKALTDEARKLVTPNPGKLLGTEITASSTAAAGNIFYKATATKSDFKLSGTRGTLSDYVYRWSMTYNGKNTVVANGKVVEIVFGYGDPMDSETVS